MNCGSGAVEEASAGSHLFFFFYFCGMRLFILLLTLSVVTTVSGQLPDSVRQHIDTSIAIMKQHSLYTNQVNWDSATQLAYREAATARNKEQSFAAIAAVFTQLQDHHGFFSQYNDQLRLTDSMLPKRYTQSLRDEWAKGPRIKTQLIGDIAYLRMPGMQAFTGAQIDRYANWLADSINSLAARQPTAWILDLRMNTGGNIIPMMSPLACFFKDGIISYYMDRNNSPVSVSEIKKGIFYLDDTSHAHLRHELPALQQVKVAVLIGAGTASSGEGVAAIFKERKKANLFGEPSSGYANSTEGYVYNNDNSYFLLTTARLATKKKKVLPEQVSPDVAVVNNDSFNDLLNDNAIKAALKWLSPGQGQ